MQFLPRTVRAKLLAAFIGFALIVGVLGVFTVLSLEGAGVLVTRSYKQPFMAINYAHRAHIAFDRMDRALHRLQPDGGPKFGAAHVHSVRKHYKLFKEDISIARNRSVSDRATELIDRISALADKWMLVVELGNPPSAGEGNWKQLESLRNDIVGNFDTLANVIAGDAFILRERGLKNVADSSFTNIVAICAALLFALIGAIFVVRNILRPLGVATGVARQIAQGQLDTEIPPGGDDETGTLLRSMKVMQDNLRRKVEREVTMRESAQDRLADAIESCPVGVILTDAEDMIVAVNSQIGDFLPEIAELLKPGVPGRDAVCEANLRGVFDASMGDTETLIGGYMKARRRDRSTDEIKLADGRWIRINRGRTVDGGTVGFWTDITELKERESVLRTAKDAAEAASRAKSDFLANMSHELRTPLNAMIGFAEIISHEVNGPVGNEEYLDYANEILNGGKHLVTIINDILDLSKSEAGKLRVKPERVSLKPVIEFCTVMFRDQCRKGGIDLIVDIDDRTPAIDADPDRLKQVLLNILANAVKFTAGGGTVSISVSPGSDGWLNIRVSDTGVGMRPEDIATALEPFGQVDSSMSRSHQGAGLGLPMAERLVGLHGGSLSIESRPGIGTTVIVRLPMPAASRADKESASARAY